MSNHETETNIEITACQPPPKRDHSDLVKSITKEFGEGAIQQGDAERLRPDIAAISTGSLGLDLATGIGGIPRGRVVEIFGAESTGKSTLSIHIMAEAIRAGGSAAYIDAEHALDPIYAANCGLDISQLLISQPDNGEQALNIVDRIIRDGSVDIIVVDSVASLVPEAEVNNDIGHQRIGLQAKMMSEALRKLNPTMSGSQSRTALVFTNQVREKIGVFYGNPETTPGGRALRFYASMRIEMKRIDTVKDGAEVTGSRVRARVVKNKVAPPFRQAEFEIIFNAGINRSSELFDAAERLDIITKQARTLYYGESKLGVGKDAVTKRINNDPELAAELLRDIQQQMRSSQPQPSHTTQDPQ